MSSKGNLALSVRNLGKQYRIAKLAGHTATTLAESLLSALKGGTKTSYT
ncbi:MAG: hypothetical protein H7Y38_07820, partial [Armatimonadetes bacterium]|nr:hypothetical protein [Armatimonadota bacterium]